MSRAAFSLIFLAAAAPALAQPADELPASRERPEDAPAATAPSAPPPIAVLRDPREADEKAAAPTEQVFISPSGEPFRAALGEAYPVGQWFAGADTNGDGALTAEEFNADQTRFFDLLDTDKDGVIDGFESNAYEKTIAPEVATEFDPRGALSRRRGGFLGFGRARPRGTVLQGAAYYGLLNEPLPVRAADTNFDFKITRAEALAAAQRRFTLLDTDKDGRIAWPELPRTQAQARAGKPRD